MSNFSTTICYLFAVLAFATATNVRRCYHCNSTTSADCVDPFNPEKNSAAECSSLIYNRKERNILSLIEREERTGGNVSYVCIKVVAERDSNSSLVRSCAIVQDNIEDMCNFIQREAEREPNVRVTSCNICDTDECNTGAIRRVSAVLLGIILFFASGF